jgi:hypothetical protein
MVKKPKERNIPYYGITHKKKTDKQYKKWKEKRCPQGKHLFDECKSSEHYLVCDACGLVVHIAHIETEEQICKRVAANEEPPPFILLERNSHAIKTD